jgi:hypothetical protein
VARVPVSIPSARAASNSDYHALVAIASSIFDEVTGFIFAQRRQLQGTKDLNLALEICFQISNFAKVPALQTPPPKQTQLYY